MILSKNTYLKRAISAALNDNFVSIYNIFKIT